MEDNLRNVLLLLSVFYLMSCAGMSRGGAAQEIFVQVNIDKTTKEEIMTAVGIKPRIHNSNFSNSGIVDETLTYVLWRSDGKYARINVCREGGKCLEQILTPDNPQKQTNFSFRFADGICIAAPGAWRGDALK
jgi:hypothetical protein